MARRNDAAIAAALEVVAQAVGQQPNVGAGNDGVRMLETFLRNQHSAVVLQLEQQLRVQQQ